MIHPAVVLWQGQQVVTWVKFDGATETKNVASLFQLNFTYWRGELRKYNHKEIRKAECWVCRCSNRSTTHGRPSVRRPCEWSRLRALLLLLPCKGGCKGARSYTSTGCLSWLTGCSACCQRLPLCPYLHKVCSQPPSSPRLDVTACVLSHGSCSDALLHGCLWAVHVPAERLYIMDR